LVSVYIFFKAVYYYHIDNQAVTIMIIARIWIDNRPSSLSRSVKVGDMVRFLCNSKGRGGHHQVTAKVTKLNTKTLNAVEFDRSYSPGVLWRLHEETELEIQEYSSEWKEKFGDPEFKEGDEVVVDKIQMYHGGRTGKVIRKLECGRYEVQFYRQVGKISPSMMTLKEKQK
jgi:hypothetical protein